MKLEQKFNFSEKYFVTHSVCPPKASEFIPTDDRKTFFDQTWKLILKFRAEVEADSADR